MRIPKRLLPHSIEIEPFLGTGARGKSYGPAETWDRVYVEDKRQVVVSPEGEDTTSNTFIVMDAGREVPDGSMVTVWKGTYRQRRSMVVGTSFTDMPGMPSNLQVFIN